MMQCREHALKVGEPYGVWGGLSESERNEILRAKPSVRERELERILV